MLKDDPYCFFVCCLIMLRDWVWGVHDPSRRQVLSRGMGSGPSGGSRTHPPSPFKSWWSCSKCFMMIDVCMLGRDWGCGVRDPSRRQVLSQWMGLGPSGGSLTHPPLPRLIWGLMLILIQLFVMIILWMFWGDLGWGMRDTPRRQILSQWMGLD